MLILQRGFTGLGTSVPVALARSLLVASSPDGPSDNGGGFWRRQADPGGKQAADFRHGEGQQIG